MFQFLIFILSGFPVLAHPVLYKDGVELIGETQERESKYTLLYSPLATWSLGLEYSNFRDATMSPISEEWESTAFLVNHRLKRWNGDAFQANIYLTAGAGLFFPEIQDSDEFYQVGVQGDWETTRYYFETKYNHWWINGFDAVDFKSLRLGFAPYVLSREGINTWLIVQWAQMDRYRIQTTPLFRFYFENVLFEVGHSLDGEFLFNFMIHH